MAKLGAYILDAINLFLASAVLLSNVAEFLEGLSVLGGWVRNRHNGGLLVCSLRYPGGTDDMGTLLPDQIEARPSPRWPPNRCARVRAREFWIRTRWIAFIVHSSWSGRHGASGRVNSPSVASSI